MTFRVCFRAVRAGTWAWSLSCSLFSISSASNATCCAVVKQQRSLATIDDPQAWTANSTDAWNGCGTRMWRMRCGRAGWGRWWGSPRGRSGEKPTDYSLEAVVGRRESVSIRGEHLRSGEAGRLLSRHLLSRSPIAVPITQPTSSPSSPNFSQVTTTCKLSPASPRPVGRSTSRRFR